ncbi:zinc finger, CCHC-type containing protein [Tanacetum coccineum]
MPYRLYLQIVASIEQYSDLDEMTLEEAIGRLKTYEERIKYKKGKQVDNQEKLMFTRHEHKGRYSRGRGRGRYKFSQGKNHENFKEERKDGETSHKNYNNNSKKSNFDTSKLTCYKCKKIGHIAPRCPQKTKPNEQSNLVEEDLEPTLLMATLEEEEQNVSLHEEDVGLKRQIKDVYEHGKLYKQCLTTGKSGELVQVRKLMIQWLGINAGLGSSASVVLFYGNNFVMATMCFEKAGDTLWETLAKASGLRASAYRMLETNHEAFKGYVREAAGMFESIGKIELAASCYCDLKEYERADNITHKEQRDVSLCNK